MKWIKIINRKAKNTKPKRNRPSLRGPYIQLECISLDNFFFFLKTAINQFQNFSDVNEKIGELKGETGVHGTPGIFWLAEAEFQPLLALYRSENRLMAELSIFQQNNTPHLISAHVPIEFKMLAPWKRKKKKERIRMLEGNEEARIGRRLEQVQSAPDTKSRIGNNGHRLWTLQWLL